MWSPAKARLLEQLGVKAYIASLDDHDKLESLASSADAVFNILRLFPASVNYTHNEPVRTTYREPEQYWKGCANSMKPLADGLFLSTQ